MGARERFRDLHECGESVYGGVTGEAGTELYGYGVLTCSVEPFRKDSTVKYSLLAQG